jgi:endoglucanase
MMIKKHLAILFLYCFFFSHAQFVRQNGKLGLLGTQLVNEHKEAVVLRGVSFGWHNLWPRFYNHQTVAWLKNDWNVTVVRASMGIDLDDQCYLSKPIQSKSIIEKVIDAAIQENIYVIVDWHSHNLFTKEAVTFFSEIAEKYGNYPNIIYEIFNEPDDESWEEIVAYSKEVIKTIRKYDSDNIILIGCPNWCQDIHLAAADPIKGYDNLMYTVHFYAATHGKWLRDRADAALKSGLPIFISESAGMEANGNGPINMDAWELYINWMEKNRLSWVTWSISDKDETCSMLQKSADSNGCWNDTDLKKSGVETKNYLMKYK